MVSQASLCLFRALFVLFISSSLAYNNLYVGGKDGWVVSPSETYNHWAERNRFQVNDTLVFKYKKGSDLVFQVSKEDYHNCNTKKPIRRMTSGESVFQFDHSGSFYFISGKEVHCQKGQKLTVIVLGVRAPPPSPMTPPPASQTPPAIPPKAPSPEAPPTTPAPWHQSPTPAPKAPWSQSPSPVLVPTPSASQPPADTPEKPPSPHAWTPTASPTPKHAHNITSPAPEEIPPSLGPPSAAPPQENTPSPSQNGTDADIPPEPTPSGSLVSTPSSVSILVSVLLISLVMGVSPSECV